MSRTSPGDHRSKAGTISTTTGRKNHMRKLLPFVSGILLAVLPLLAEVASASDQTKDDERLRNSGTDLKEILDVPDNVPQGLLDKADCVVVFPSVLKAAFIVGASRRPARKDKLGAGASMGAGPGRRQASPGTDPTLRAEILSYSRARGL